MRSSAFVVAVTVVIGGLIPHSSLGEVPVKSSSVSSNSAAENTYGVLKVRKDGTPRERDVPCRVKRGEGIWIDVLDIDKWLQDPKVAPRLPGDHETSRLVPFINGHPLQGVYPDKGESYEYRRRRAACRSKFSFHT